MLLIRRFPLRLFQRDALSSQRTFKARRGGGSRRRSLLRTVLSEIAEVMSKPELKVQSDRRYPLASLQHAR
jgi:hypothetical protein